MKNVFAAAVLALAAGSAAQAAGTVQVHFVKPENFADVGDRAYRAEDHLKALERVLVEVAAPRVPDGQTLRLDVLDVDLAGEVRPGGRAWDTRVMRGRADWPRITLRWALDGQRGEAVIQDMAYLQRVPPAHDGALAHERRMLDEWFRERFGP